MKDFKNIISLSIGLIFKLLAGLLAVKLCAELLGPNSFGLTGQVNGIMAIVALVSGAGVSVGMGKIYADSTLSKHVVDSWHRFSYSLVLGFSSLVAIAVLLSSPWLFTSILDGVDSSIALLLFIACSAFPLGIATVYQGRINGLQRSDVFAKSQVVGALLGLIGFLCLVHFLKENGALAGMVWLMVSQALSVIFFSRNLNAKRSTSDESDRTAIDSAKDVKFKFLIAYGGLNVLSGILMPSIYIIIRYWIEQNNSDYFLGLWQASVRISEAYCQLPMTFLTVVLFGRFAANKAESSDFVLIRKGLGQMAVLLLLIFLIVLLTRDFWIPLIFNENFIPMRHLVGYQVIGDFLRMLTYVLTTYLAARGMLKFCFFAEVLQATLVIVISYFFIPLYPQVGAHYAYVSAYTLYFVIVGVYILFVFNWSSTQVVR